MALSPIYKGIPNYLYLHHFRDKNLPSSSTTGTGTLLVIPSFADSVQDSISASFLSTNILQRTAPIYSYENSGPRTVQVSFNMHRDMMDLINMDVSNAILPKGEDYVDYFIRAVQASVMPAYDASTKMVNPPLVSLRMGNEIYIKGIINSGVGITYHYPIIGDSSSENFGKYSNIDVSLSITEITPYQAQDIIDMGSFRGFDVNLERNLYQLTDIGDYGG